MQILGRKLTLTVAHAVSPSSPPPQGLLNILLQRERALVSVGLDHPDT